MHIESMQRHTLETLKYIFQPKLAGWLPGCLAAWLPSCLAEGWMVGWLGAGWLPACLAVWLAGWLAARGAVRWKSQAVIC